MKKKYFVQFMRNNERSEETDLDSMLMTLVLIQISVSVTVAHSVMPGVVSSLYYATKCSW
jgi:hypothetical protein